MTIETFLTALPLFITSMLKFLIGLPSAYLVLDLNFFETLLFGLFASTASVLCFTFFSEWLNKAFSWIKVHVFKRTLPTEPQQEGWIERIANKFGIKGLAFITPIGISFPVGIFLAVKLYKSKGKVISNMIPMAWLWALILSGSLQLVPKDTIRRWLHLDASKTSQNLHVKQDLSYKQDF